MKKSIRYLPESSSSVIFSVISTLTFHYRLPLTDRLRDTFFEKVSVERQIHEAGKPRFAKLQDLQFTLNGIPGLTSFSNFPQASISIECSRYSGSSSLHMKLELNQAGTPARGLIKVRYFINATMVKANLLAQHTRAQS